MGKELKACVLCCAPMQIVSDGEATPFYSVDCSNCPLSFSDCFASAEAATVEWNTRAQTDRCRATGDGPLPKNTVVALANKYEGCDPNGMVEISISDLRAARQMTAAMELLADHLGWADRAECLRWIEAATRRRRFNEAGCKVSIAAALGAIETALILSAAPQPVGDGDGLPAGMQMLIDNYTIEQLAARITRDGSRMAVLEGALEALTHAVEADFCDATTDAEAPDEDSVHAFDGKLSPITFGIIRRARQALEGGRG
ncbi:MAG: hypothetical protein QOH47_2366 [Sphingomonadales bacterium]|jgi:hypothetical protein|nr:hypothetical protein [Sphingomonadales bacterium]